MVTPIILTVIGIAVSVITLFLLMIKFVKEPLDKRIDGVETNLSAQIDGVDKKVDRVETNLSTRIDGVDKKVDRVETNLSAQIDGVDKKVDKLYEILLTHYMDKDKEQ